MKLDRKTLVEYLLATGFNANEITELTKEPRTTIYRIVDAIKEDKYSLYSLSTSIERSYEQKIKRLLAEISISLEEPTNLEDFEKLFYTFRCYKYLESTKGIDFGIFINVIKEMYDEANIIYKDLPPELDIVKHFLTHLVIKEARKKGIVK